MGQIKLISLNLLLKILGDKTFSATLTAVAISMAT